MTRRPEHVLLVRSGRHLHVALAAIAASASGARVTVLATPGVDAELDQAGIPPADRVIYRAGPRFDAWPLARSGLLLALWRRRIDRVVVLWVDPDGSDRANVDRTALALAPRGFDAVTPDGTMHHRRGLAMARAEVRRAITSVAVEAALTILVFGPARVARALRRRPAEGA